MEFEIYRTKGYGAETLIHGRGWGEFEFLGDWAGGNRNGVSIPLDKATLDELERLAREHIEKLDRNDRWCGFGDQDLEECCGNTDYGIYTVASFICFLGALQQYMSLRRAYVDKDEPSSYFIKVSW